MVVNVTELTRGDILELDGDPWQVAEVQSQTPSARGASLLIKAKIKNLRTGQSLAKTWRGGETVTGADVTYRQVQFLYRQGGDFTFMDLESYEQLTLDTERVGCECEGNFNCDADVDGSDASIFKLYFGRGQFNFPCNSFNPCRGDFDCDADVDGTDASRFKADFGRNSIQNPCPESPTCAEPDWCSYPN